MENIEEIKITGFGGQEETHVIIDHGNDTFTAMLKSTYDEQQAAQATLASELSNPSTPQAGA